MRKFKRGDGYVGGVCQGLGEYTNTDPIFWRLLFFFVLGPIVYLIMWALTDTGGFTKEERNVFNEIPEVDSAGFDSNGINHYQDKLNQDELK